MTRCALGPAAPLLGSPARRGAEERRASPSQLRRCATAVAAYLSSTTCASLQLCLPFASVAPSPGRYRRSPAPRGRSDGTRRHRRCRLLCPHRSPAPGRQARQGSGDDRDQPARAVLGRSIMGVGGVGRMPLAKTQFPLRPEPQKRRELELARLVSPGPSPAESRRVQERLPRARAAPRTPGSGRRPRTPLRAATPARLSRRRAAGSRAAGVPGATGGRPQERDASCS